jgi:hypothetical protein
MLTKTYFYKRNLFALVSKAQLILSSYSLWISYTLNSYSRDVLTKNLFTFLITKMFKFFLLYPTSTSNYTMGDSSIRPKKVENQKIVDSIFPRHQPTMSTTIAPIKRETNIHTRNLLTRGSSSRWRLQDQIMAIRNDEDSANQTNRNYRKGLLILIKLPLPHD